MNTTRTTSTTAGKSLQKAARIAGFMYLLIIITSLLSMVFVAPAIIFEIIIGFWLLIKGVEIEV